MITNQKSFASYSVNDMTKALDFYKEVLGLNVTKTEAGIRVKLDGGLTVFLYPKPDHEPATFTVLNLGVESIEKAVAELNEKKIKLEHYGTNPKTDANGIATPMPGVKVAYFKDPAGNILSVMESN